MPVLFSSALALVAILAAPPVALARISSRNKHRVLVNYPEEKCNDLPLWTMDEVESHSQTNVCLMVLYDKVYEVLEFVNIHRGGPDSILRNCGKDATFGYYSLQCIPGVPDHTPGVLSMLDGNFGASIVGVIKDSSADPCANAYDPDPLPPPDFGACPIYDVLTCADLDNMPSNGRWTIQEVQDTASSTFDKDACYAVLYNYVFALGLPPQDNPFTPPNSGSLTFAEKHGGGSAPVLDNCWTDMTQTFEAIVNMPGKPDHTRGALNAILPYLVGVIADSDVDPCVQGQEPPTPCEAFEDSDMRYYTMEEVGGTSTSRCHVVVLGKVYDLQDFMPYHYGGADEIQEHCRQDVTKDFFEKSFHTLVQLGAIQDFQRGVIQDGMADPCNAATYIPNPDGTEYGEASSEESQESSEN